MALVNDMVFSLLVLASGVFAASTIGFGIAWMRARDRAIRAEARLGVPPDDARTDSLEDAIDAMAAEVERMSEGQRFVTRLLSERPAAPAVARAESVVGAR